MKSTVFKGRRNKMNFFGGCEDREDDYIEFRDDMIRLYTIHITDYRQVKCIFLVKVLHIWYYCINPVLNSLRHLPSYRGVHGYTQHL